MEQRDQRRNSLKVKKVKKDKKVKKVTNKFIFLYLLLMAGFKKAHIFRLPSTTDKIEKFINFIMLDGKKNIAR
jgi:hypothetical protein